MTDLSPQQRPQPVPASREAPQEFRHTVFGEQSDPTDLAQATIRRRELSWEDLQEREVPRAFEVNQVTPSILCELVNVLLFPHDEMSRWNEQHAAQFITSLQRGEGIATDLLGMISPVDGRFRVHQIEEVRVRNRKLVVSQQYQVEMEHGAEIFPLITIGVDRMFGRGSEPWIRISWDDEATGALTHHLIRERWAAVTYAGHLAGEWQHERTPVELQDRESGQHRLGSRCQLWTQSKMTNEEFARQAEQFALHPDLLPLCAFQTPSGPIVTRPLTSRVLDLQNVLRNRMGIEVASPENSLVHLLERDLRKMPGTRAIPNMSAGYRIAEVGGRLLVASPRSTVDDLLTQLETLRAYERDQKRRMYPDAISVSTLKFSDPRPSQIAALVVDSEALLPPALFGFLNRFVVKGTVTPPTAIIDQLLELAGAGRSVTVSQKTSLSIPFFYDEGTETQSEEEEDDDDDDEVAEPASESTEEEIEVSVNHSAKVDLAGLGIEGTGMQLDFIAVEDGRDGAEVPMVEYQQRRIVNGLSQPERLPSARVSELLMHAGVELPKNVLPAILVEETTGNRTVAMSPTVFAIVPPLFPS